MMTVRMVIDILCLFITALAYGVSVPRVNPIIAFVTSGAVAVELIHRYRYRRSFRIPRWLLNTTGILFTLASLTSISLEDPLPPLIESFMVLLTIKWLEDKKARDYFQILLLSLFLFISYAFYTTAMSFLFIIAMAFLAGTLALILLSGLDKAEETQTIQPRALAHCALLAAVLLLLAIPTTFLLFFILPRTEYPLLPFLNRGSTGTTGFSSEIRLGEVSSIQESNTVALRAKIEYPKGNQLTHPLPTSSLYWRGIVFDLFDGKKWYSSFTNYHKVKRINPPKDYHVIVQKVILEPHDEPYLFCLDVPIYVFSRKESILVHEEKRVFQFRDSITSKTSYECYSTLSSQNRPHAKIGRAMDRYLYVPPDLKIKLKPLVDRFITPANVLKTAYTMTRWLKHSFHYSLEKLPMSENPLEEFLFKSKRGNCEYFASALGVMLRIAGIPSRLVGGYKGGYFHRLGRYYVVFQKDAHVWVEAYTNDGKWHRLDPTPPAILDKTKHGAGKSPIFKLKLYMDLVSYFWSQMVISYDFHKQIRMFSKLGRNVQGVFRWPLNFRDLKMKQNVKNFRSKRNVWVSILVVMLITITIALKASRTRQRGSSRTPNKYFRKFTEKLRKYGIEPHSQGETVEEMALRLRNFFDNSGMKHKAESAHKVIEFAKLYSKCLYGKDGFSKEKRKMLQRLIDDI